MLVVVALPLFAYRLVLGVQYVFLVCWRHLCNAWCIGYKRVDSLRVCIFPVVVRRGCTGRSRVVVVCFVVRRALVLLWFGVGHALSKLPRVGGGGGVVV